MGRSVSTPSCPSYFVLNSEFSENVVHKTFTTRVVWTQPWVRSSTTGPLQVVSEWGPRTAWDKRPEHGTRMHLQSFSSWLSFPTGREFSLFYRQRNPTRSRITFNVNVSVTPKFTVLYSLSFLGLLSFCGALSCRPHPVLQGSREQHCLSLWDARGL